MKIEKYVEKAAESYSENTKLRVAVQVVPYLGGAIDTLLTGKASKIQEERLYSFISQLCVRLNKLEHAKDVEPSEELFDFMYATFEGVVRSRSEEKREHFAKLVKKQVERSAEWEEAETALRLLKDLEDIHLRILLYGVSIDKRGEPYDGLQVFSLTEKHENDERLGSIPKLTEAFPQHSEYVLQMACSELVSKYLICDTGVGGVGVAANEYYALTDLAYWFLEWADA